MDPLLIDSFGIEKKYLIDCELCLRKNFVVMHNAFGAPLHL
jgi:hypothetical protein